MISSVLFFAAFIEAVCVYIKDRQWLDLKQEIEEQGSSGIKVFRGNGEARYVSLTDLVVGDIVSVDAGNKVPADCILIEEMNITVDETIYGRGAQESKSLS